MYIKLYRLNEVYTTFFHWRGPPKVIGPSPMAHRSVLLHSSVCVWHGRWKTQHERFDCALLQKNCWGNIFRPESLICGWVSYGFLIFVLKKINPLIMICSVFHGSQDGYWVKILTEVATEGCDLLQLGYILVRYTDDIPICRYIPALGTSKYWMTTPDDQQTHGVKAIEAWY